MIKGSDESLKSKKHYLSREAYLGLSERKQFTFASQRERIYNIFEKYLVLKRQYGDYDAADRYVLIHNGASLVVKTILVRMPSSSA